MLKLKQEHKIRKRDISAHLKNFDNKNEVQEIQEFLFCILTPQSKAEKCWEAITLLPEQKSVEEIRRMLRSRTRFHNTKTDRLLTAYIIWPRIKSALKTKDKLELRDWVAETVPGYGLKEAGHFLRNIGHSRNQVAILDRHILRNLMHEKAISKDKIKGNKDYKEIEKRALSFSKKVGIPIDELDLLFWHKEHGKYFK